MRLVQLKNHSERQDFLRKAATIAAEDQSVDKSYLTEELITRSQDQKVSSITSLPKLIRLVNNCISGDAQSKLKGKRASRLEQSSTKRTSLFSDQPQPNRSLAVPGTT